MNLRPFLFVLFASALLVPSFASAATMSILPATRSASIGDLITTRVSINTEGTAINESEGTVRFPADVLEVASITRTSSIFSLWVEEPNYSNTDGTITFDGGVPTPGYSGSDGTVAVITFRAKKAGTATVQLASAAVRANDGLGTDVLRTTNAAAFSITAAATPPSNPIPVAPPAPAAPGSVLLSSNTHPDQSAWYANPNPIIDWILPAGADAIDVLASDTKGDTPSVRYSANVKEKQVKDLADGTWYFNLRYRKGGVWSAVSSYQLNIDTHPPTSDTHSFVYDETQHALLVSVSAADSGSGIKGYELTVDQGEPKALSSDAFAAGPYQYLVGKAGSHTVALRVIDKAGNHLDIPGTFTVSVSVLDTPVFSIGSFAVTLFWLLVLMGLISILSLLAAFAAWYRLYTHHEKPLVKRTGIRKNVHHAFVLLREDLDKNLRALQKARDGRELTKAETMMGHNLHSDLNDFERYLNEQTDLLD